MSLDVPRKAMLLCAGLGERLRPLTLVRAKPALPFAGEPLVRRNLAWLARAGVQEVVLNLHHLPETVRDAVGDGRDLGLRVHWSEERDGILGTAGGLAAARAHFEGEPSFLLVNGDCVHETPLSQVCRSHARAAADGAIATLVVMANPDPASFRPVEVDRKGTVVRIAGLPAPAGDGADAADLTGYLFAGIHVLGPEVLRRIPEGRSDINRDVYPALLAEGALVTAALFTGFWHDLGTPGRYLHANREHLRRSHLHSWVHPSARVSGSATLLERTVVGAGARVEEGAEVRGSVLLDGARVGIGAWVENAILGPGAEAGGGEIFAGRLRCRVGAEIVEREIGE